MANTSMDYANTFANNSFKNPSAASANSSAADWGVTSRAEGIENRASNAQTGNVVIDTGAVAIEPSKTELADMTPEDPHCGGFADYYKSAVGTTNTEATPVVNGQFRDIIVEIDEDEEDRESLIVEGYVVTYRIYQTYDGSAWNDVTNGDKIIAFELSRKASS